jgi:hypothetical protein
MEEAIQKLLMFRDSWLLQLGTLSRAPPRTAMVTVGPKDQADAVNQWALEHEHVQSVTMRKDPDGVDSWNIIVHFSLPKV